MMSPFIQTQVPLVIDPLTPTPLLANILENCYVQVELPLALAGPSVPQHLHLIVLDLLTKEL